jgi:hypothetical protein
MSAPGHAYRLSNASLKTPLASTNPIEDSLRIHSSNLGALGASILMTFACVVLGVFPL